MELLAPLSKAFFLVFVAEFGDKSQLVAMTLAARYRAWPVLLGAIAAFAVLNLLGVTVGVAVARWLPEWMVLLAVATLFTLFGIKSLREEEDDDEEASDSVGKHLIFSVFMLIFLAEFGDKTQLAVAGMAGIEPPLGVWLGGTLALAMTTLLGVVAGRTFLQRLPIHWIHRFSGVLFLIFATVAWVELWPWLVALV